jgi:geranylgeranylglycerol-phosphate geranylgeranyltransferase
VTPRTLTALVALVRLPNGLVAAGAVFVGGRWAGGGWWNPRVALAAASAVALTAVANAVNDYQDASIDVVAHPNRPIPSGAIAARTALGVAGSAAVIGIGCAAMAAPGLGLLSLGVVAAMVSYGVIKARSGVAANAMVAALGALPFLYGAWAAGVPSAAAPLVALAAPLQFAREVAKDIDDVTGDRGRRQTLPLVAGTGAARAIGTASAIVAIAVLATFGHGRPPLAAATLFPAGAVAGVGAWRLAKGQSGAATIFKVAMVLAILAMVALAP